MTNRRTTISTAWTVGSAALLVVLLAAVGLAGGAEASTAPPPSTDVAPSSSAAPPPSSAVPAPSTSPTSEALVPMVTAPYGTVGLPVLQLGQEQTATGHDYPAGTLVRVTLEPDGIDLGTYRAAADGTVTTRFATARLLAGTHTVRWTPV